MSEHRESSPAARTEASSFAYPFLDPSRTTEERAKDLVSRLSVEEKIAQMTHDTPAIERLGIPAYSWWNEALHGVARNGRATVFPQAIGLAATFDEALVQRVATAISDEARAKFNAARSLGNHTQYTGLTFWSPNVNLFRDPRWGRGQETYGEDPFLTSRLGVAFVRGLQGDDPAHLKTAACAKHYAVHSGPEALRHEFDVAPSPQDLVESYLPAFEALVTEARVEGVMTAYNRVYGKPASGSEFLIQQTLRGRWRFDGYVVSDCWALEDFHAHHHVTRTASESAARALEAGVNLDCGNTYPALHQALEQRLVSEEQIDAALVQLLKTRFRLGLFDPHTAYDDLSPEVIGSANHRDLAREAAVESFVLLKNQGGVLPLKPDLRRLMLLGPYVADAYVLLGNYYGVSATMTTLLEGITGRVHPGTSVEFKYGFLPDRENVNPIDWSTGAAHRTDAIIVTLGLSGLIEGEEGAAHASEHKGDRQDIGLPAPQLAYLKKLKASGKTPIIVVLFGGSPLAIAEVHDIADAVLLAWYPGQEGGRAIAEVLFGDRSPSGRLPVTFPRGTSDLPAYDDYRMDQRGYRYAARTPLYPFGFGLTYGAIQYESIVLSATELAAPDNVTATVRIRNHGSLPVEEVAQLYLTDLEASTRVPKAKLVGFQRVPLAPREVRDVTFLVPKEQLRLVTEEGQRAYEVGEFELTSGGASPGARAEQLGGSKPVTARFRLSGP